VKQDAFAKINLYLHILGRRPDGYHELETLMALISIHDTLEIDLIPGGEIEFTCSYPALSDAKDNLATKAARLFLDEFKLTTGVRIHLDKKIPVGAGLGGGSSDAATVLRALNMLTKLHCPNEKLIELAARLGSDVPFFVLAYGPTATCRGRGEIIEETRLTDELQGVLVHPGFGVSTPWAYKTYAQNPRLGESGRAFADFTLRNDLEPPAFSKYPWLPTVKSWFQKQPEVLDSLMSGSGSSVFALTKTADDRGRLVVRFRAEFGETLFAEMFSVAKRND
jgi:4-diphosphocytidyl-2-C-methyl-D-erythritol kinase